MLFGRFTVLAVLATLSPQNAEKADSNFFQNFQLPAKWQEQFWADSAVTALLDLDCKKAAELVPIQAGLKHCRCPNCGVLEQDDPLSWSIAKPDRLVCRKCSASFPDEKIPAKTGDKVPEDVVEVLPRTFHHYPYHLVEAEKQLYPDERIYLAAKRDYEAREFLAKLALYAAVKYRDQDPHSKDPRLARLASVLLLRFAQVYPLYATHFDRAGSPKTFDRADLKPPFRRAYGTAKWDWSGCMDVPINLVIAYGILRDDAALVEAGKALNVSNPKRAIERDLFHASAEFVRLQPEEYAEASLLAYRGMLAVGRLLEDPGLVREASSRFDEFLAHGFYHDGLWRDGDGPAHRRIVTLLDGWINPLLAPEAKRQTARALALVRDAGQASWIVPVRRSPDVLLASWPSSREKLEQRRSALLGGAGLVRFSVGQGDDALDLELRGLGDHGVAHSGRLALRLAVGGQCVLGDLEDGEPTAWGFENASASRSGLVLVDGLNQRETIDSIRRPSPGADIEFFAADRDFQIARMVDRFAYPKSTTLYRHTILVVANGKSRYAVSIVEVDGGLQHDQIFHGPTGALDWKTSAATQRGPESLLPPAITFVPTARAEDGRWFIQSMGAFLDLSLAVATHPEQALVRTTADGVGVRLHILNDTPLAIYTARSPAGSSTSDDRPSLILRRQSELGETLKSTFVTVFEPIGRSAPLRRVGRVQSDTGLIVIAIEAAEGTEYIAVNATPGRARETALPDGRLLKFDGHAVRVTPRGPILAGGTFAEVDGHKVTLDPLHGTVVGAGKSDRPGARGVFRVSESFPNPRALLGRTLLIRHGDGSSRGWTIVDAQNLSEGGARLHVFEDAGLRIDPQSGSARYERFPGGIVPGPHQFGVSRIAR